MGELPSNNKNNCYAYKFIYIIINKYPNPENSQLKTNSVKIPIWNFTSSSKSNTLRALSGSVSYTANYKMAVTVFIYTCAILNLRMCECVFQ